MEAPADQNQKIPEGETIDQILEWVYTAGILRAAIDLRIWEKAAAGAATAGQIAAGAGWDPVGTRRLLEALCGLKLLEKEGDRYIPTPESAFFLNPGLPTYLGGLVMHELNWEGGGRLAAAIRSGTRPIHYDATTAGAYGLWIANYSRAWVHPQTLLEAAGPLWHSLNIAARDGLRVLDIACGPAPYSLALGRGHPGVRLTWVDWDEVLRTAWDTAARLGIESQVSLLPGDLWSADFGHGRFDVAYLGNVTHFFSPAENTRLFAKVYAALDAGGTIVVNSLARREQELPPSVDLWLYAVSAGGGVYTFEAYKAMLEAAGFTAIEDIDRGPIKAVKPAP